MAQVFSSALSFSSAELLSPGIVRRPSVRPFVCSSVRPSVNMGTNLNGLSYDFHIIPVDPLGEYPRQVFHFSNIIFQTEFIGKNLILHVF